jgi:hypothetical protein
MIVLALIANSADQKSVRLRRLGLLARLLSLHGTFEVGRWTAVFRLQHLPPHEITLYLSKSARAKKMGIVACLL